jgi:hypothetical protein
MPSAHLASHPQRCDTFIASAVLVALIVGWILNFVNAKEVALRLDSLIGAATHWT